MEYPSRRGILISISAVKPYDFVIRGSALLRLQLRSNLLHVLSYTHMITSDQKDVSRGWFELKCIRATPISVWQEMS